MNAAPQILWRSTPFVCRACLAASRKEYQSTAGRLVRHFSSRPASATASTTTSTKFKSYSLPSHPPTARPRNSDVTVETSITQPIEMPPLPRVHETRPPSASAHRSSRDQLSDAEKLIIPEGEAQESKKDFVSQTPTQSEPNQLEKSSTTSQPSQERTAAVAAAAGNKASTSNDTAPRKSRLRAPRKAAMKLTPAAVTQLRSLLDQPEPKLIKVGVRNRGCSGLAYHLEFVSKASPFDETVEQDGVKVLIDSKALFSIIGSEMDWAEDKLSQRFFFRNPNIKEECGCGESFMV